MNLRINIENPLIISKADNMEEAYMELLFVLNELYSGHVPNSTAHWFVYKGGSHIAIHQQNINGVFPERSIFIEWPQ